MDKKAAVKAIRNQARANGCICDPDIRVTAKSGQVHSVSVAHDSWCRHRTNSAEYGAAVDHAVRSLGRKQ